MADENVETSPFCSLPVDCISNIISFTSPIDACRAAAVSTAFKSAAGYDAVWERFLPHDYRGILSSSASPVTFSSKKALYFLLCNSPLLVDGGKLSFRLSRSTGKKCYMLCARELQVAWIDNPLHWEWISLPESRFGEVAELLSVYWLDIRGILKAQMLSPNTHYVSYLVFKLSEQHHGLDCSSKALMKIVDINHTIQMETSPVYIVPPPRRRMDRRRIVQLPSTNVDGRLPRSRADGWLEIELGKLPIGEGDKHDVHAQLLETEYLNWKRGLIIEGIELRPKEAF